MATNAEHHRRDRILDAAESAFAEFGYAGASLREVVRQARVNLATVYYYFQSKDGLIEAVLKRRFGPIREEQLKLLDQLVHQADGRALTIEQILEALLLPPLRLAFAEPAQHLATKRLIGRLLAEPHPRIHELMREQHAEVRDAFLQAMQASCPQLHPNDLRWRKEFLWGALAFVMCNPRKIEIETRGACDPVDFHKVLAEMIAFAAGGFRAAGTQPCPLARRRARTVRGPARAGRAN